MALEVDRSLEYRQKSTEEVIETMKLTDRTMDVLIGIVLGATIGLHYPLEGYKLFLVLLSVIGVLKLAVK